MEKPKDGVYNQYWHVGRQKIQKRKQCFYKNGLKHGPYRKWTIYGRLYLQCNFTNGILNGEFKEWIKKYPNDRTSTLIEHSFYNNDRLHGDHLFYHNGELIKYCLFEHDRLIFALKPPKFK